MKIIRSSFRKTITDFKDLDQGVNQVLMSAKMAQEFGLHENEKVYNQVIKISPYIEYGQVFFVR